MHVRSKHKWMKHIDFIILDAILVNISLMLAYVIRMRNFKMFFYSQYRSIAVILTILHLCIVLFSSTYSDILYRGYFTEFKKVALHTVKMVAIAFLLLFVMGNASSLSRIILVGFAIIFLILSYFFHILWKKFLLRVTKRGENMRQYVIVTDQRHINEVMSKLQDGTDVSFSIKGICLTKEPDINSALYKENSYKGVPIVAIERDMYDYCVNEVVDGVVICLGTKHIDEMRTLADNFLNMGVTVYVVMNLFAKDMPHTMFTHLNSARVISTSINTASPLALFIKRMADIVCGIVGCIATGILFIFLAPLIKKSDPKGGVFFKQERAGRNGRTFYMYKFRSMYVDAEERKKELMQDNEMEGLMFKIDGDPRILGSGKDGKRKGIGYFIRVWSLDEFPNAWSILKGDMSVVGTRPPTMDEYEKYELRHKSRLAVKPGLTGLWQVSGRSDITDFEEIVKLDNEYIQNWTVGLDIKIMLKTFAAVFKRQGSH
ncbi:MAG: exopolysaccharide biosynthesis polyprenyl glycosylphosphotransferase [Eubacterium sp.]|nr:exopolysaccharide biosynthesis polyprenyl glycosylphosphotransferase [Eubacterium sp.]